MNAATALGPALTAAGIGGSAIGAVSAYPGRGYSSTSAMAGITLLAVGDVVGAEAVDP